VNKTGEPSLVILELKGMLVITRISVSSRTVTWAFGSLLLQILGFSAEDDEEEDEDDEDEDDDEDWGCATAGDSADGAAVDGAGLSGSGGVLLCRGTVSGRAGVCFVS
jgi:hypothetical protein